MKKVFGLAALVALFACPVFAQNSENCEPREFVIARLASQFGEARQWIGVGANDTVVEGYASEETGTWTIVVTKPNGQACMVAFGEAYENLHEELPPQGEPT